MNLRVYGRKNYATVEIHPNLQMDSMLVTVFNSNCNHKKMFIYVDMIRSLCNEKKEEKIKKKGY